MSTSNLSGENTDVIEKTLDQPFHRAAKDVIQEPQVYVTQAAYSLSHSEFIYLKTDPNVASKYINEFLTVSVGYFVITIVKFLLLNLFGVQVSFDGIELIYAFAAIFLFTILRYISDRWFPGKKNKLMKRLEQFYEKHPVSYTSPTTTDEASK